MRPQDPSTRPDLVGELRLRVPLPVVVPVVAIAVIFVSTLGFSRILLGVTPEGATTIALVTAANILVACAFVALRPRMHRVGVLEVALIALYPVLIGVVLAYTGFGQTTEAAEPAGEPVQQEQGAAAPGGALTLTAQALTFDTDELQLPAEEEASVTLDNQDTAPHNFSIYRSEQAASAQKGALFRGDNVDAGSSTTYEFEPPKPGRYYFHCDIHPTMNGEVVVS
jgi:plastocyanin